ncbi:MAG TPA: FxsA family protein [Actinomycetes bacterium]|nr:FxsA family protein [Actinomycetes bacterium]
MSLFAFFLFVVAPLVEIASIVVVAKLIGWWTVVLLAAAAVLGIYVLRRTGRDWMRAAQTGAQGRAAGDSALLFAAGILLIWPGFISDVIGLLLLVPLVRVLLRGAVASWFVRRFTAVTGPGGFTVWTRSPRIDDDRVIRGEIIREDEPPPPA